MKWLNVITNAKIPSLQNSKWKCWLPSDNRIVMASMIMLVHSHCDVVFVLILPLNIFFWCSCCVSGNSAKLSPWKVLCQGMENILSISTRHAPYVLHSALWYDITYLRYISLSSSFLLFLYLLNFFFKSLWLVVLYCNLPDMFASYGAKTRAAMLYCLNYSCLPPTRENIIP